MEKRLTRSQHDRMIAGVAGGLAEYMNLDPVIIRFLFVLLTISTGWGILLYIILALIMREEDVPTAKANAFDDEEIIIKDA